MPALRTHDDFRSASTAELLALFFRTPPPESDAKDALIRILARLPTTKAERQIHAGAELARRLPPTTSSMNLRAPSRSNDPLRTPP